MNTLKQYEKELVEQFCASGGMPFASNHNCFRKRPTKNSIIKIWLKFEYVKIRTDKLNDKRFINSYRIPLSIETKIKTDPIWSTYYKICLEKNWTTDYLTNSKHLFTPGIYEHDSKLPTVL